MKIDHIEVIHLKYEYPADKQFRYAGGVCGGRLTSLVLVHTDSGPIGHGSVYTHPALAEMVIKQQLEPILKGEDANDIEGLWNTMYGLTRWYGRKGAAMSALGAIDTALWDLRGQRESKPVWALLGGSRAACPAYASALLWKEPAALAAEAVGYIDQGFHRVKMRLARDPEYDRAAVIAVRKAIGNGCDLIVDGSMRYSLEVARELGRFLAEQKVFWLEEPFAPENLDAFVQLRGTVGVRLAAGENEFGEQGFRELIRTGAVDIVQPDACRCGGISEMRKIADLARSASLPIATHSWSDGLAILANAHVVSAIDNGLTVEIDRTGNPFVDELLVEPLRVRDGQLSLSNKPGLGIELNRKVVDRYRIECSEIGEGLFSDMAFGKSYFTPAPPYGQGT